MRLWSDPRRRRWLLWAILAAAFLLVSLYRLSTAVIADDLMAAFRATGTQLGVIHATFFAVYAVMQIPTGVLVDRVGPRLTAAAGGGVMNLGAVWFTLAGSYPEAVAARFFIGLGGSVLFVAMLRFCASWYGPAGFSTMNGLCFAVGGLGGILATTPFALAVETFGWQSTVRYLAIVGIALAGATAIFVRDSPDTAGFEPIAARNDRRIPTADILEVLGVVVRDRWIWVVCVLLFCGTGVNLTLFGLWGIPYVAQAYNTSVEFASIFTFIGGIGAVIGPPGFGWIGGRTGRRSSIVILGGIVYAVCLGALAVTGTPPLVVVALVYFLVGALLGAFVITYPLIKERYDVRVSGIALGTINGAGFVGAAVFPTATGLLLDSYWTGEMVAGARVYTVTGYRFAFGLAAIAAAVTVVCGVWLYRADPTVENTTV